MRIVMAGALVGVMSTGNALAQVEKSPKWEAARDVATAMRDVVDKADLEKSNPRARQSQVDQIEARVKAVFGGDINSPKFGGCHRAVHWLRQTVTQQNILAYSRSARVTDLETVVKYSANFGDDWRYCRNAVNDIEVKPPR